LFAFNFTGLHDVPDSMERGPVTTAEAFRLIMLTLWVTKIEWLDEEDGQPEDWETVAGSSASQASTPAPGVRGEEFSHDEVRQQEATATLAAIHQERENWPSITPATTDEAAHMSQTPPVSAAEPRPGHTSEDGLYHKPSSRPPSPPTAAEPDAPLSDTECPSTSTSTFPTPPKKKAKYPVVHFEGRSRSLHIRWDPNANSHIRGKSPVSFPLPLQPR